MTVTLTQFLIEARSRHPAATGQLNSVILSVAVACKSIAARIGRGALGPVSFDDMEAGLHESARYELLFVPVDEPSNLEVNLPVGSIFSILRREGGARRGCDQVAAGYVLYGAATMIVLSVGDGVHGFTLDRSLGEFLLTHPRLRVAAPTSEFAINASNTRFWESPVRRYVSECLAGTGGCRARDFSMRWIASPVAEAHRILLRGGVFLHPRDASLPSRCASLRLRHECNPIAFLVEQAGGRASTGRGPILALDPGVVQEQVPLVFGTAEEVERIEAYHAEDRGEGDMDMPLFRERGLFRESLVA